MNWKTAQTTLLAPLLIAQRLGVLTDMDGTISPIVSRPEEAYPTERSRTLLAQLAEQLTLVGVISGRGAGDLQSRVNLPNLVYIGNHGLERWKNGGVEVTPEAQPYRAGLEAAVRDLTPYLVEGMQVEDKGATVSIHYRRVAQPEQIATQLAPIVQGVAEAHGVASFPGRMIFELRPPIYIHKGTAFRQVSAEYYLDAAVFIGDDTTDADAMRAARDLREAGLCYALGIGVLSDPTPQAVLDAADVVADGIADVESFFAWLIAARASRN